MRKIIILLVIIFMAGLACSFLPLSLRLQLHSRAESPSVTTDVPLEKSAKIFFLESLNPSVDNEPVSKAGPTNTPDVVESVTTNPFPLASPESEDVLELTSMPEEVVPETLIPTPIFEPQYTRQMLTPVFLSNFAHVEAGCNWLGIAGQVFDAGNQPREGMLIVVKERMSDVPFTAMGYSGLALDYGPAGYEIVLADQNLGGEYSLQLFGLEGEPLSAETWVTIPAGCESNLVLINFLDEAQSNLIFMPLLQR